MRNTKRAIAIALVLVLALAQVAFAADVSTVNGIWMGKMSWKTDGLAFTKVRVKLDNGKTAIQAYMGKNLVKTAKGTYTVSGNNIVFSVPSVTFLPERGVMTYELKPATKTKPSRLLLNGYGMGIAVTETFNTEPTKVLSYSYAKVKRNAVTKLKIRTSNYAEYVIVYDKDGVELGRSELKNKSNVFTVPITFAKKTNTVYAKSGIHGVDDEVQTWFLSAAKKITVKCK